MSKSDEKKFDLPQVRQERDFATRQDILFCASFPSQNTSKDGRAGNKETSQELCSKIKPPKIKVKAAHSVKFEKSLACVKLARVHSFLRVRDRLFRVRFRLRRDARRSAQKDLFLIWGQAT